MQTAQIPQKSKDDANNRIVCTEGCTLWVGRAGRPWWIFTGGIGTCVVAVIYEFNTPAPQVYFYHFLASGPKLLKDFQDNLPPRLAANPALFRVRLYRNPNVTSANSEQRIEKISKELAAANRISVHDTNGGFNLRLATGEFKDGTAGSGALGNLRNLSAAIDNFYCLEDFGGLDVPKKLPEGW